MFFHSLPVKIAIVTAASAAVIAAVWPIIRYVVYGQ